MGTPPNTTTTNVNTRTENDAVIQSTLEMAKAQEITTRDGAPAVVLPTGKRLESLNHLRVEEEAWNLRRIKGLAVLTKPESFVAHVERFLTPTTVIYATDACVTATYDYHDRDQARRRDHSATYAWPLSPAWKAWQAAWGRALPSLELSELLEDRIIDVLDPHSGRVFDTIRDEVAMLGLKLGTAAELLAIAKEFRVSVKRDIAAAHNTDTGEVRLEYSEVHDGARGARDVTVPTGFLLGLPVHEDGSAFQVIVRLRYVIDGSKVKWTLKPYGVEELMRVAVKAQVDRIQSELPSVPVLWGRTEV